MKPGISAFFYILTAFILSGCSTTRYQATFFEPPTNIDTRTRPIEFQEKRSYTFNSGEIHFDNLFDGARMNSCEQVDNTTFLISITPENSPINHSPWYAFRIISNRYQYLTILLEYTGAKHRYIPKLSTDGEKWTEIPEDKVVLNADSTTVLINFPISSDTTWIAGQEIINSKRVVSWCRSLEEKDGVRLTQVGVSKLNRPLYMMDTSPNGPKGKPTVVILCRQHPPEVTGYFAMKAFVETILEPTALSDRFLKAFRVLIFPLMNPDGVDLGHWRHNAGGVDLNRDWGTYYQPETRQFADAIVNESEKNKSPVILGLDFHSTQYDVYYTKKVDTSTLILSDFKNQWLQTIENRIPDYTVNEESSEVEAAVFSNNWFYKQFNAIGITYEIGDTTPRDFIETKGRVSATAMMELLLGKKEKNK